MTEYVVLHPPGDTVEVFPAHVDEPKLVRKSDVARLVKRMALERQLAELDAEDGVAAPTRPWNESAYYDAVEADPTPLVPDAGAQRYAGTFTGADGVKRTELHFTEKKRGPQYVCECSQAFYEADPYRHHIASCATHRAFVADPRYEKGAFVHGSAEPKAIH